MLWTFDARAPDPADDGEAGLDALLSDYLLDDDDGASADFILLDQLPSVLGDEIISATIAALSDHLELSRAVDVDRVRSCLLDEFDRTDMAAPVKLDGLGAYITDIAYAPRAGRMAMLDVAWALRELGYTTSLDKEGLSPARPGDPASWRRLRRPRGEYVVQATFAVERPFDGLIANTVRLSLCLGAWLICSSCIGL